MPVDYVYSNVKKTTGRKTKFKFAFVVNKHNDNRNNLDNIDLRLVVWGVCVPTIQLLWKGVFSAYMRQRPRHGLAL